MSRAQEVNMKLQENKHEFYINEALIEAKKAFRKGEVPVGAIIVYNNKIIARAYNNREKKQSVIGHAEILAIKKASKRLKTWRLEDCILYVTLEPCPMCAGAIIQSRIKEVYYTATDLKSGVVSSIIKMFELPFNHQVKAEQLDDKDQSKNLLKDFFKKLRNKG